MLPGVQEAVSILDRAVQLLAGKLSFDQATLAQWGEVRRLFGLT